MPRPVIQSCLGDIHTHTHAHAYTHKKKNLAHFTILQTTAFNRAIYVLKIIALVHIHTLSLVNAASYIYFKRRKKDSLQWVYLKGSKCNSYAGNSRCLVVIHFPNAD